jgi:hypothetical protein
LIVRVFPDVLAELKLSKPCSSWNPLSATFSRASSPEIDWKNHGELLLMSCRRI